jgi:tetratricopeptide (TPR) repeat protein
MTVPTVRAIPHPRAVRLAALFACVAALGATLPRPATAADEPPPAAAPKSPLAAARAHIAAKRWQPALDELKKVNARGDADWNNLMGYVHRKMATPDLAAAEGYYNEALRIDPKHLNALEYSGELYLMKGEPAKADERLATLAKACNNCEQLRDLKAATERYKKNGKYVPE